MKEKILQQDLLLPLLVIALLAVMILPLPIVLIDILIILNITFSLLLLISALYITKPEKFTTLPSLLLLSTVFRLGLNVATTRQLLANSIAPQMVVAFGNFVVNSNIAVGVVIFFIITLVQFLVIAKGAERVAEVCARFSLDAMPGKQMAIDADLRSGIINTEEARGMREELQRESKVYGSLDGAMKFIKGDTIAGIVIVFINITAGFLIGILQKDLNFLESLSRYTIFTIGDGLISQIPAILTAISAGIAVTRVGSADLNQTYSSELIEQLTGKAHGLRIVSFVLILLALMPGFPSLVLSVLAMILFVCSLRSRGGKHCVDPTVTKFQPELNHILSIEIPKGKILESEALEIISIINKFKQKINKYSTEIINDTHSRILLDQYHQTHEDLINSLFPKYISITTFTKVLKQLLVEEIPIKNIPLILQTISEIMISPQYDKLNKSLPVEQILVSEIRIADRRNINRLISTDDRISGYALNSKINKILEKAVTSGVAVHPALISKLSDLIESLQWVDLATKKVILTTKVARSILAKSLKSKFSDLHVMSYEEIADESLFNILGEISFPEAGNINILEANV